MANKTFKSISEALAYLETNVVFSLEQIGEEIKGVLRQHLMVDWYSAFTPTRYERTYQLIDSLSVKKAVKVGKGYQVEIFFDPDKITPIPASQPGYFPAHMNITNGASSYNGMSYGELLPYWVEEGQHSSIRPYEGVHMVQNTKDWVCEDHYLKNRMIELLEMKGFQCI